MTFIKYLLIFLAGATFFHAIEHIFLPYYVTLPLEMNGLTLTSTLNLWAIIASSAVTLVLLWLASKINR